MIAGYRVRAELLRQVSGWSSWGVVVFVVAIPAYVAIQSPLLPQALSGNGGPTNGMWAVLGWSPVTAMFLGSLAVTREFYYSTMEHTVVLSKASEVLRAKLIATAIGGALIGLVTSSLGVLVWGAAAPGFLAHWTLGDQLAETAGAVVACALAGVIGVCVGWVVENYYLATAIVLAGPLGLEIWLAGQGWPGVDYLPATALSHVAHPVGATIITWLSAVGVTLLWTVALLALALITERIRSRR